MLYSLAQCNSIVHRVAPNFLFWGPLLAILAFPLFRVPPQQAAYVGTQCVLSPELCGSLKPPSIDTHSGTLPCHLLSPHCI